MPIDRSRNVDPRTAEIRLASVKQRPQTAFPTLFTKHPAHTFASGHPVRPSILAAAPLYVSMVRTYIRKGGHGGDRSKAGLPAGYWQEKGCRAAAAAAKAAAKAKESREEEAARRRPPAAGGSGPSTVMSSSRPAISCKQCNARLVSLD